MALLLVYLLSFLKYTVPGFSSAGFPCLAASSCSHLWSDEFCTGRGVSQDTLVSGWEATAGWGPGLWAEQRCSDLPGPFGSQGYPATQLARSGATGHLGGSYLCHKALGGLTVLLGVIGDEDQIGIAFVKITLASCGE